jgi:hypothetical protein
MTLSIATATPSGVEQSRVRPGGLGPVRKGQARAAALISYELPVSQHVLVINAARTAACQSTIVVFLSRWPTGAAQLECRHESGLPVSLKRLRCTI